MLHTVNSNHDLQHTISQYISQCWPTLQRNPHSNVHPAALASAKELVMGTANAPLPKAAESMNRQDATPHWINLRI